MDRTRSESDFCLKDRLLYNTARSIKKVQEHVFAQQTPEGTTLSPVLTNDDVMVQPLFKHLDRLFMSGLKKINVGYWPMAAEMSHREVVKEMKILSNITTSIGRGRAWLYHTLNENLLECYLRTIESNEALVKRFYDKSSLFFDQQRMQILITLCSGLECVEFCLDYDVPYLDVDSYLHLQDQDTMSACSSVSTTSQSPDTAVKDVANVPSRKLTNGTNSQDNRGMSSNFKADDIVIPNFDESFEVERINTRHHKKKKKRKKPRAVSIDSNHSAISGGTEMSQSEKKEAMLPTPAQLSEESSDMSRKVDSVESADISRKLDSVESAVMSRKVDNVESADMPRKLDSEEWTTGSSYLISDTHQGNGNYTGQCRVTKNESDCMNSISEITTMLSMEQAETKEHPYGAMWDAEPTLYDSPEHCSGKALLSNPRSLDNGEESSDFCYIDNFDHTLRESEVNAASGASGTEESWDAGVGDEAKQEGSHGVVDLVEPCDSPTKSALVPTNKFWEKDIQVDNNLLLTLMLEVFDSEEEQFHKMYETTLGHSEGNVIPIRVIFTDRNVYLLRHTHKLVKHAVISYTEIDYVSLSLGLQMVQIVCTNRRKQFWLTTGSETLTKHMVEELRIAMRLNGCHLPESNILTDATTQRIALTKWASKLCRTKLSRKDVQCLLLCYWEDRSPGTNIFKVKSHKEGTLLYKLQSGYIGLLSWKPGYFVLSGGVLYLYEHKDEQNTPLRSIQIGSDECGGCRRSKTSDREHSLEIILSNGSVLHLSAASNEESNEWLQCLCQAVSEGQTDTVHTAVACCVAVTPTKVSLCHEDVQTEYFRTLASGNIEDITSLAVDPSTNQYLLINFESQESNVESEQWAIYLCGSREWSQLVQALDMAWSGQFQVSLPVTEINDVTVTQQCHNTIRALKGNA